jgi:hypothetical protein
MSGYGEFPACQTISGMLVFVSALKWAEFKGVNSRTTSIRASEANVLIDSTGGLERRTR